MPQGSDYSNFENPPRSPEATDGDGTGQRAAGDAQAALEPHIQDELGRIFRSYCDDLINQPVPDKFLVLLAKLEAKQRGNI